MPGHTELFGLDAKQNPFQRIGHSALDDEPLGAPAQLDPESERRIKELLDEGQQAFDGKEYQSAIDEAREKIDQILATHQPLPLEEDAERELDRIQKRAQEEAKRS